MSERVYADPSSWEHAIAHLDMDAFFASVELLRRPELRGKPVIVGPGGDRGLRGVVAAASYEARRFGVRSAMPLVVARRRCPGLVVVPHDMERYRAASAEVMALLGGFSEHVEVVGLDEAYVDLSDSPAPKARARELKREIRARTRLTCSIGLGPNRLVAKIASDLDKPDGLCVLSRERFGEIVGGRPARIIPGVGPRTAERLEAASIRTVADLAAAGEQQLAALLGPRHGAELHRRARGYGSTLVGGERRRKSESRERTFPVDETDPERMRVEIDRMARQVATHLGRQEIRGRTVTLKVRLAPFRTRTRSRTLPSPTADPGTVAGTALELFDGFERDAPVRLLGVGVSNLEHDSGPATEPVEAGRAAGPEQLALT